MSVTSNIVLELLQYFIVILIIFFAVKKAREACLLKAKLSEKIGNGFEMRDFVFPFKSLYSKANALQHASFLVALTVSLLQIGQLLIHDIFVGGAPSSPADIIWMIAYYVGSLLLGALGYLLMLLTLMKLDSHEIKLKTNNQ